MPLSGTRSYTIQHRSSLREKVTEEEQYPLNTLDNYCACEQGRLPISVQFYSQIIEDVGFIRFGRPCVNWSLFNMILYLIQLKYSNFQS